jgi:phosphate transport system protein
MCRDGSDDETGPRVPAKERTMTEPGNVSEALGQAIADDLDDLAGQARSALSGTGLPAHPTRESLDRELREIKDHVLRMGTYVEDQIRATMSSLVEHDADAATEVILGDRRLNEVQRRVSSMITATIATQQPVARDLRFLLALDRVSYELERMGDHTASVAKQARKLAPEPPLADNLDLVQMGELDARLVHAILRALVAVDEAEARRVATADDEIDRLYHQTFDEVLELMRADPANVDRGTRILFAAHYLERIGDRATNIAEDVVFLATGEVEDLNP